LRRYRYSQIVDVTGVICETTRTVHSFEKRIFKGIPQIPASPVSDWVTGVILCVLQHPRTEAVSGGIPSKLEQRYSIGRVDAGAAPNITFEVGTKVWFV
jgi:hypothetical protein